jgi:putative PEP-CTERM system histidine kinase
MELSPITSASYDIAAGLFVVLGLIYTRQTLQKIAHWSLPAAFLVTGLSLAIIALDPNWLNNHSRGSLIVELLRYLMWVFALSSSLRFLTSNDLPKKFKRVIYGAGSAIFVVILYQLFFNENNQNTLYVMVWSGLALSVIAMISVEQLYKNIEQNRQIKLLCLNIDALFIFDIYLYAHSLNFNTIDPDLWQARAVVSVAAATVILIGALTLNPRSQEPSTLSFSRPIAFYTTSLTTSGLFIAILSIGGYYVQNIGGQWGTVIYALFLFSALLAIAVTFISSTARAFLSVFINKHFFSHKYDYRNEWLKLIRNLSIPALPGEINERAFHAISDIIKCHRGALWLRDKNQYVVAYQQGIKLEQPCPTERYDSDFCTILRKQEWVFIPDSGDETTKSRYNEYIPRWLQELPNVWLILPLLTEHDLYGFMVLEKPKIDASLTWEDRDLLKTVGRQVSSYLERHKQAQQIVESSQFDTFHRLSAFIMHDLKNLIAQQALVVQNAAKHKDNPAFIEDAITTIDNSVGRMSGLLKKLQQNEPSEIRTLSLKDCLLIASRKCQNKKPAPTLRLTENDGTINADKDRLIMALTHLINNAQDATPNTGFIDVGLKVDKNRAQITIEDSGSGMEEDFIKTRLFKPFDSTKEGKGMGIGVYQAKEVVTGINGTLDVASTPGEGSTFTITLPIIG